MKKNALRADLLMNGAVETPKGGLDDPVRIALVTEGTYPHARGGVSVWCDQLVRGLAGFRFDLYALVGTGSEHVAWELPSTVDRLVTVPLWGRPDSRQLDRRTARSFPAVFERFLNSVGPGGSGAAMARSLQELHVVAQSSSLTAALLTDRSVDQLLQHMIEVLDAGRPLQGTVPIPTVHDAVTSLQLVEHYLRPLSAPVPDVDLCHSAANGMGSLIAMGAKWRHGTPFVLTEHGIYLRESLLANGPGGMAHSSRQFLLGFIRRVTQAAYRLADVVSPGSDYNKRWELAEGVKPVRIRRIHNGIDPARFAGDVPEPDEPVVTWLGRVNPLKDLKTLLRSFARVVAEVPNARLRIYGVAPKGDEGYLAECQALLVDLGLEESATFEGGVDDAADAYHAGQVVMLTSISEGFPYAAIEAMACARPSIATDVGGVSEASVDPNLLAPARDDEALAAICTSLLADADRRRDLGARSRQHVIDHFTLDECVDKHADLYRDILHRTSEAPRPVSTLPPRGARRRGTLVASGRR